MAKSRKDRVKIGGAFIAHKLEMRQSPAWRALPDEARRVLDCLEVEHAKHGGAENGALMQTYAQFQRAGIRKSSISLAIRQCEALGFVKVQRFGYANSDTFRPPNRFTVTHLNGRKNSPAPTNDWEQVRDEADAAARLRTAAKAPENTKSKAASGRGGYPLHIDSRPTRVSG